MQSYDLTCCPLDLLQWELVDGPDLLDLLNSASGKKLSEPMAAFYFQQLLDAVIFMHNNGYCHRDLKAENCVIDRATHCVKVSSTDSCLHIVVESDGGEAEISFCRHLGRKLVLVWSGLAHPIDLMHAWLIPVQNVLWLQLHCWQDTCETQTQSR